MGVTLLCYNELGRKIFFGGYMTEARKEWENKNKWVFSISIMRNSEADIVAYLQENEAKGVRRGTLIKEALREKMAKNSIKVPEKQESDI
jgi:hypothetical protein